MEFDLPEYCYSVNQGSLVLIRRGTPGFMTLPESTPDPIQNLNLAISLNKGAGVSAPQRAAMESGAAFGWYNLMASPKKYDEAGRTASKMGYVVKAITRIGETGIVFAENPDAVQPYVTWRVNESGQFQDYYWGHYFTEKENALKDYHDRIDEERRDQRQIRKFFRIYGQEH